MNDWSLIPLNALIVTDWEESDWEEDPDMTPVEESIDRPWGRDPEMRENEIWSPLNEGVIEIDSSFARR